MARKKIKLYETVSEMNVVEKLRSEGLVHISESGGLSEFWEEIKRQGEAIRANPAIIPRNHVWVDETARKNAKKSKK